MDCTKVVDRYFAAVRGQDLESVVGLFAENATMVLPDGKELQGVAALRAMYQHLFAVQPPTPTPTAIIPGAKGAAVEIEARFADGTSRRTANFFHLDPAGSIQRLSVYQRGG